MPNAVSPPSSVASAALTWRNICLVRRPRSPSWNQHWVWRGASLGCNYADSADYGWIWTLSAWAPSWPCVGSSLFKNCITMLVWDCTWGNKPWWKTQTTGEKPSHKPDYKKCGQWWDFWCPSSDAIQMETAESTTVDLAGWEGAPAFHLNFGQSRHQSWCQSGFLWICWRKLNWRRWWRRCWRNETAEW